jgi:hypothetical protein
MRNILLTGNAMPDKHNNNAGIAGKDLVTNKIIPSNSMLKGKSGQQDLRCNRII